MQHKFNGILGLEKLIDLYPQEAYLITLTGIGECEIVPRPERTLEEMTEIKERNDRRAPFEKWFISEYEPRAIGNRDCSISWKAWEASRMAHLPCGCHGQCAGHSETPGPADAHYRILSLETALRAFVDWDTKYPKGREWHHSEAYQIERELDALCESARKLLPPEEGT